MTDSTQSAPTAPCLFCDQANSEVIGESASWYIRLDAYPANPGHVELVTKRHVESLWGLDGDESAELYGVLAYARNLVEARIGGTPDGWTIGVNEGEAAGRSIPHLHVHLIPRHHGDVADPRGGIRQAAPNCDPDVWGAPAPAGAQSGTTSRVAVDRSDLTSALIPIHRYIDRTPDDDTADHLTGVLARFRAALEMPMSDTEPTPGEQHAPRCVCGDPIEWMDGAGGGWIHSPGSDTPCLNARPAPAEGRTLRPQDVPDELTQMMADAEFDAPPGCSAWDSYRTVLTAVIPHIERQVREQIATEIRALADQFGSANSLAMGAEAETLRWAADRIAREGAL